jgi:Glycosyltransferase
MSSSPIKVLFAHTDSFWGGDKAQMVELAAGLDRSRFEPLVVTTAEGALTEECDVHGVPRLVLPFSTFRRNRGTLGYLLRTPHTLYDFPRRHRIGLVHAHCDYSTISMERMARWAGIPFVQHVHDMDRGWVTKKKRPVLARADAVVAISHSVRDWLIGRGVPPQRVRVAYNGVHLEPMQRAAARETTRAALGLAPSDVAVGVFARLEPDRKGQHEIIRAIAQAAAESPLRLFLIGGDDHPRRENERAVRARIAELGVGDRVTMLGHRRDVPALMAAMDLLGAPFYREGFGRVVVEGMAAGLPVVGFRSGALPELVRDNEEGVLVEAGNVEALAGALTSLAADRSRRSALGANGDTARDGILASPARRRDAVAL